MHIDSKLEGGNIQVISIGENQARLAVELRDTVGDWFYWGFRVTGAAGRTVTFTFEDGQRVGYYGAAVSHDQIHWQWTNTASADYRSFTYAFGPEENEVYFNHSMRYSTAQFASLCTELGLETRILTVSERGRPVPYVEFGSGEDVLLFTSRHHACESTGTYVLEGVIRELYKHPIENYKVIAIPFADMDGVVDGDQGKARSPHDHGADYEKERYASVRAIKQMFAGNPPVLCLDLHSPWHFSGIHDVVHIVRKAFSTPQQMRFGSLLTARNQQNPGALRYDTANDLPFGVDWNTKFGGNLSAYMAVRPGVKLSTGIETPYFGKADNVVSQSKLIELGVCMAQAVGDFLKE